tara:strand:- start:94 stop:420 length:327 start_codon:yes stop_codon:yes gene_type:complete
MGLTYDYTKCDSNGWGEEDHKNASDFCWSMMTIDMNEITEKTHAEISFRFRFLEKLGLSIFTKPIDQRQLGKQLRKLRGYKTNIGFKPRFKFIRRHVKRLENTVENDR